MDAGLAAIIVHDIKNALAVLEGELRDMAGAPTAERAAHAHRNCLALQEKLIGFLTLYKASTHGLAARIEAVSPEDFLDALLRQTSARKPGLAVTVDTRALPVVAFFDENLVSLALEAALQNAARFARSQVHIGCRKDGDLLLFTVHDDGPGINAKEEAVSTGLGMDLCKAIAEAHCRADMKGTVVLRDHPEGGAVFELRLP